jgi:chlorite dismutase
MADHPAAAPPASTHARRGPEPPDIFEKGGMKDGQPQRLNERLFMQFLAFGGCADSGALATAMKNSGNAGVLYEDVNDPRGVGLLTFSEDPGFFLDRVRPMLHTQPFASLVQKPEYTPTCCCSVRAGPCSIPNGSGRSTIRCAGAASSRSCRPTNSV